MVLHLLSSLKKVIMLSIQLFTLNINLEFFLKSEHEKKVCTVYSTSCTIIRLFRTICKNIQISRIPINILPSDYQNTEAT